MTHKISFLYPLSLIISFGNFTTLQIVLYGGGMEGGGGGGGGGPQENTCIYALEYEHKSVDMNVNVGVTMC